ncbi:MAG: hypothetical protein OEY08_16855, partial [Gammaproteobacteria bacterium]|nr:hypothetical protein [Gammaproteobacteria bacterium]
MNKIARYAAQAIAYLAFAALLGYFATMPPYEYGDPAMSTVKVSLSHAASRVKPCVQLTPEQIAEFAANMRRTEACERARLPLVLELDIDDEPVLRLTAAPTGMWSDGPASVYQRFDISPGEHRLSVRIRDTARTEGWDYERSDSVTLEAGRYFTVSFKAEKG